MMGNSPRQPIGNLSALEKALSRKQKPMKPVKAMPNKVSGKK